MCQSNTIMKSLISQTYLDSWKKLAKYIYITWLNFQLYLVIPYLKVLNNRTALGKSKGPLCAEVTGLKMAMDMDRNEETVFTVLEGYW